MDLKGYRVSNNVRDQSPTGVWGLLDGLQRATGTFNYDPKWRAKRAGPGKPAPARRGLAPDPVIGDYEYGVPRYATITDPFSRQTSRVLLNADTLERERAAMEAEMARNGGQPPSLHPFWIERARQMHKKGMFGGRR